MMIPAALFSARRALLIGIDKYNLNERYNGNLNIIGCCNDALDIKSVLIERFDFQEKEIRLLLDGNATRDAILNGLQWLIQETGPQDWVFFSFSGHGTQINDQDGDEDDNKDECICPADVEPKFKANVISDDEMSPYIQQLKNRRAFFLFDSCHSGTMKRGLPPSGRESQSSGFYARLLPPVSILEDKEMSRGIGEGARGLRYYAEPEKEAKSGVDFSASEGEVTIFSAAAPHQVALPVHDESSHPNGAMTYSLLMGLKGEADRDGDGMITYRELLDFCSSYVQDILKLEQEPQMDAEPGIDQKPVFFLTPQAELAGLINPSGAFQVYLNLAGRSTNKVPLGRNAEFVVRTERAGYLYLFCISTDKEVTCLLPNEVQGDNYIRANEEVRIPPANGGFFIQAVEPMGIMKVIALVFTKRLDLESFCGRQADELLHTLKSDELKRLVQTTRGLSSTVTPADWAAKAIEIEIVK